MTFKRLKKTSDFYWQGVLLVCFFCFFILIVQFNHEGNKKKHEDWDLVGLFFSVYVVPVTAGTVSGILALSKSLEL